MLNNNSRTHSTTLHTPHTHNTLTTHTGVQFVCLGLGYFISIPLSHSSSLIVGVVIVFVAVILSGFNPRLTTLRADFGDFGPAVTWWSYARWSMEALYVAEVSNYNGIYAIQQGKL